MLHGDERKGGMQGNISDLLLVGPLREWQQGTTGHPYKQRSHHFSAGITMTAIPPASKGVVQRQTCRLHRYASEAIQRAR
jgi:hypothetical protein